MPPRIHTTTSPLRHITESFYPWGPQRSRPSLARNQQTDTRVTLLTQQLLSHTILNNTKSPMRKPYNINTNLTSLVISLASHNIALRYTWHTLTNTHHTHTKHTIPTQTQKNLHIARPSTQSQDTYSS